jgi:hypothetical protein
MKGDCMDRSDFAGDGTHALDGKGDSELGMEAYYPTVKL